MAVVLNFEDDIVTAAPFIIQLTEKQLMKYTLLIQ
jgi:hypothetical protein